MQLYAPHTRGSLTVPCSMLHTHAWQPYCGLLYAPYTHMAALLCPALCSTHTHGSLTVPCSMLHTHAWQPYCGLLYAPYTHMAALLCPALCSITQGECHWVCFLSSAASKAAPADAPTADNIFVLSGETSAIQKWLAISYSNP